MPHEEIAAFTESCDYPAFINVSKMEDGKFRVTVRSGGGQEEIADIYMSYDDFNDFIKEINVAI